MKIKGGGEVKKYLKKFVSRQISSTYLSYLEKLTKYIWKTELLVPIYESSIFKQLFFFNLIWYFYKLPINSKILSLLLVIACNIVIYHNNYYVLNSKNKTKLVSLKNIFSILYYFNNEYIKMIFLYNNWFFLEFRRASKFFLYS